MNCATCGSDLGGMDEREAFICLEVMGDEYIESYWHCSACGTYMQEVYHDRFCGEDDVRHGPIDAARAEAAIAKIRQCPEPGSKRCDCAVHQELGR